MPRRVGLGLIGLDHWYHAFGVLDDVKRRAGAEVVGVADRSRKRLGEVEENYRVGYVTTDYGRVISDPKVDLVCTFVPTGENAAVVGRALRAGKHVASVKPMAMTLGQADGLIELAEEEGRVLCSFDQCGPLGREGTKPGLKALIERGAIGRPLSFHQTLWAGLPMPWRGRTGKSWWLDPKLAPFGAWADHAIYAIDTVRYLFDAEVESVHGEIANKLYPKMRVEDYGLATLRLSNGVVAVVEDTWTGGKYITRWTKIVGTDGVIRIDQAVGGGKPVLINARGVKRLKVGSGHERMLVPILALVRAGRARPSPARESRENLRVALAVYRSAKTRRYVSLKR